MLLRTEGFPTLPLQAPDLSPFLRAHASCIAKLSALLLRLESCKRCQKQGAYFASTLQLLCYVARRSQLRRSDAALKLSCEDQLRRASRQVPEALTVLEFKLSGKSSPQRLPIQT